MESHLQAIAKSYDKGVDMGRKGINLYDHLPEKIIQHPDYQIFENQMEIGLSDSGRKEIKEYLLPVRRMNFIDLGCCLNLMFNGYNEWPSTYYGVDISRKTIDLLKEFVAKNKLTVGSLFCGSIHKTPYKDNHFDIGACIGILEYFEKDFVEEAITEIHRILKPKAKFVLDIPNFESPIFRVTKMVEEHLGRPDKFNMSKSEFEYLLQPYFTIEKTENVAGMIQYFMTCKKQ